ncbi:MAG: ATP-binding protein [Gammaproteobacteria bacterium]|nr:ATP-binding protein [Gammaproteobacteria bacterium]
MRYINRHLEARLRRFAASFKVVLLVGARQVGKSTLLQHVFPEVRSVVFDPVQDIYGARHDPDQFLETFGTPLILDEVQYAPQLLAAVKRRADLSAESGQYFMTGSQNLAILRDVSESMAGRVGILRLDGLTPAEVTDGSQAASWLERYLSDPGRFGETLAEMPLADVEMPLAHYLWRGQLPGLVPFEESEVPAYWSSYVQTYVERDIRRMANIADLGQFGRFLRLCGALTGQEIVQSQLGRELGISPKTARSWIDLLTGSYQWLELSAYSRNRVKRVSGRPKGHFTDSGLARYLNGLPTPESVLSRPLFGAIFESWGVNWVARQMQRLPLAPTLYHWRVHSGAEVDLVLDYGGRLHPLEFKAATHLTGYDARGILSFQKIFPQAVTGVVIYGGKVPFRLSERVVAIPWCAV